MAVSRALGMSIESATVLPAGGGFAILRVAAPGLDSYSPLLRVERERGARRLPPIDPFDGHDAAAGSVDFLLPTVLLGLPLTLEIGGEILPLPRLETADGPVVDVTTAYLAQQEELIDLDERVHELRAELRVASDRAAIAEDELTGATDRFESALLLQRREVGVVADQLDDLRLRAAQTEATLRNDLAGKDEEIVRLALQRGEVEAELDALRGEVAGERDSASGREQAMAEEHRNALALVQAAADRAEARVTKLSAERRGLEDQLATLAKARAEVEGEGAAALEDAERRLAEVTDERDYLAKRGASLEADRSELRTRLTALEAERDDLTEQLARSTSVDTEVRLGELTAERDELNARVAAVEAERDAIDERRAQFASELAEAQTRLAEEREAVETAYDRIAATIGERDELSGRVESLQEEREALLERQRAQGAASIQQLQATLEAKRVEIEERIAVAEREAERRVETVSGDAGATRETPEAAADGTEAAAPADGEPVTAETEAIAPEPLAPEDPTIISALGLAALDLDGLAELYDIATRERKSSERRGKEAQVARWDALARSALAEAERRPDPFRTAGELPRAGRTPVRRFRRRRHAKLRQQLNAAVLDRST